MKKCVKNPIVLSLLLALSISMPAWGKSSLGGKNVAVLDRMVASVNGEAITNSDVNRQLQVLLLRMKQSEEELPSTAVLRKQVLDKMILEKLQLQMAKEEGITVDDTTLNQTIEDIAKRDNVSVAQMQQFIEEQGIPFSQFKQNIKTEIILSKIQQQEIAQRIHISPSEVEQFLSSPAGQDQSGAEYRIGHILIPLPETPSANEMKSLEQKANTIAKDLKAGGNFKQTAIAKSQGQHALDGGDLGWRKTGEIPSLFVKVVTSLPVGQVYGPIKDSNGFHIIKLTDKRLLGIKEATNGNENHVRQILIKTTEKRSDTEAEALLNKLRGQVSAGGSFVALAQKFSEESSTASKGGDMGWVTPTRMVPALTQQIATLKPGEISKPFKTELGWHLVQVIARRNQHAKSEATRQKAMEILYQRKYEELLASWLRRLREDSNVETFLNES